MHNGKQVFDELAFGAAVRVAENHHFAAVGFDELGNEVESKPCKTVLVGNHKAEPGACAQSFQ